MKGNFAIPAEFWKTLSDQEFHDIVFKQRSCLNADQCARLWRMLGRKTRPPQWLGVMIKPSDLERLLKPKH